MRWVACFILMAIALGGAYEGMYAWLSNEPFSIISAVIRGCIFSGAMMIAAFWIRRIREE